MAAGQAWGSIYGHLGEVPLCQCLANKQMCACRPPWPALCHGTASLPGSCQLPMHCRLSSTFIGCFHTLPHCSHLTLPHCSHLTHKTPSETSLVLCSSLVSQSMPLRGPHACSVCPSLRSHSCLMPAVDRKQHSCCASFASGQLLLSQATI